MARAVVSETLTEACRRFAALKRTLSPELSIRSVERAALMHALYCPTCQPIADRLRRTQADKTARLEAEES